MDEIKEKLNEKLEEIVNGFFDDGLSFNEIADAMRTMADEIYTETPV